jgi:hypothetical protein
MLILNVDLSIILILSENNSHIKQDGELQQNWLEQFKSSQDSSDELVNVIEQSQESSTALVGENNIIE